MNKHVCHLALSLVLAFGFNLQAEEDAKNIELCTQQLVEIGKALQAYQKEEGNIPAWLSDLYPKYLKDEKLLLCPADEKLGDPAFSQAKDPKLPVSYLYEFNPSMKEWKTRQLGSYGDIVPIVRCWHHRKGEETLVLNLSYAFEVYQSSLVWEKDPRPLESLFSNLKKNILSGSSEGRTNVSQDAFYYLNEDQKKEIVSFAEETAKSQPENGTAFKVIGAMKFMKRDTSGAIDAIEKAMPLLPKDAETHSIAGTLYNQLNRPKDAIKAFETAFQLQPDNSRFFHQYPTLCRLYIEAGREADAAQLIDRFKSLVKADNPWNNITLGDMLMAMKKYQEALQVFEEASKKQPNYTYIFSKIAEVHEAMGNKELANEYRLKADPGMVLVSKSAPDFSGTDISGNNIQLSQLKGKVILLNFWASW